MRRVLRPIVVCAASALAACAAAHEPTDVVGGIYELRVVGESDACSPTRPVGAAGSAGVVSTAGVLSLQVPDVASGTGQVVTLDRAAGFHGESRLALAGCADATLTRSWTVADGGADAFTVAYAERWEGLASCPAAMRAAMPAMPSDDCRADLALEYRMREACAAPCEVGVSSAGPACVCP